MIRVRIEVHISDGTVYNYDPDTLVRSLSLESDSVDSLRAHLAPTPLGASISKLALETLQDKLALSPAEES